MKLTKTAYAIIGYLILNGKVSKKQICKALKIHRNTFDKNMKKLIADGRVHCWNQWNKTGFHKMYELHNHFADDIRISLWDHIKEYRPDWTCRLYEIDRNSSFDMHLIYDIINYNPKVWIRVNWHIQETKEILRRRRRFRQNSFTIANVRDEDLRKELWYMARVYQEEQKKRDIDKSFAWKKTI